MKDFDEYKTMYERSIRDPEGFWSEIAIGGAVVDFNFKSTNANQGLCAYKGVPLDMLWYTPMTPPEVLIRMGVKSSPTIMLIAKATAGDAGDAGGFSSRLGAFPQESPSFHAARRSEEMKAGIIPRTFDEFMQRDFNVLRVGNSQPLAITRAMLIIIEGVVGDLSTIDVSQSTFVRFLWKAGSNYHDCPYHNWHHAFCVVQYMAVLLR